MTMHVRKGVSALVVAGGTLFLLAMPAAAGTIGIGNISGNDASSVYDCPGGTGGTSDCYGTLTFDDGTPGVVDNSNVGEFLVGAAIQLSITLDTTDNRSTPGPFDPASTNLNRARFVGANQGTGANGQLASDLEFVDSATGNVLLAFDIKFIDVAAFTEGGGSDPDGSITLGNNDEDFFDARRGSYLTLVGGTLNSTFLQGIGTHAVLKLQMAALTPGLSDKNSFLSNDFTAGPGPANTFQMTLTHNPEPATAGLIGMGLLGMVAAARRRARRE